MNFFFVESVVDVDENRLYPQFGFLIFLVVRKTRWNVDYKKNGIQQKNNAIMEWATSEHKKKHSSNRGSGTISNNNTSH